MSVEIRLKNELRDLESRYQVDIAKLKPSELIALVHACEVMDNPFQSSSNEILDFPVVLSCGIKLHTLSLGAVVWLRNYAERWWGNGQNEFLNSCAYYYALGNSRSSESFERLTDRSVARSVIERWVMGVNCSCEEMEKASEQIKNANRHIECVEEFLDSKKEKESGQQAEEEVSTPIDLEHIVSLLEAETGIDREKWIWGRSLNQTIATYVECERSISRKAGGGKEEMEDNVSKAVNLLANVKLAIWKRMNGEEKEKVCNDGK